MPTYFTDPCPPIWHPQNKFAPYIVRMPTQSIYGTLQTASQTNITSVGNLTSLSASGTIQTTGIVYGNSGLSGTILTASQTKFLLVLKM